MGPQGPRPTKSAETTLYRHMRAALYPDRARDQGPQAQKRYERYFKEFTALPVKFLDGQAWIVAASRQRTTPWTAGIGPRSIVGDGLDAGGH